MKKVFLILIITIMTSHICFLNIKADETEELIILEEDYDSMYDLYARIEIVPVLSYALELDESSLKIVFERPDDVKYEVLEGQIINLYFSGEYKITYTVAKLDNPTQTYSKEIVFIVIDEVPPMISESEHNIRGLVNKDYVFEFEVGDDHPNCIVKTELISPNGTTSEIENDLGSIKFVPTIAGKWQLRITATDGFGNKTIETFDFYIDKSMYQTETIVAICILGVIGIGGIVVAIGSLVNSKKKSSNS